MVVNNSRRRFLKKTALGSLFLLAARFVSPKILPAFPMHDVLEGLQFFSRQEYLIMSAVADRIIGAPKEWGPTAADIDVALRADRFLATAEVEIQEQFHQLLTVFNAPFFAFLFDFRFSSFINMSAEEKDSFLEDWMTSGLAFRRTGFQALKRVSLSMFYTDKRTWDEIGYHGMFSPEDRR